MGTYTGKKTSHWVEAVDNGDTLVQHHTGLGQLNTPLHTAIKHTPQLRYVKKKIEHEEPPLTYLCVNP